MKQYLRLLFLFLLSAFILASCDKVEFPEEEDKTENLPNIPDNHPGNGDNGDDTTEEKPAEDGTITVAEAQVSPEGIQVSVSGYIVGYISGTSLKKAVFDCPQDKANTNMLLADSPEESQVENCIPIALPKSDALQSRATLNLYDHPENLGKCLIVTGELTRYFRVTGIKEIDAFEWVKEEK